MKKRALIEILMVFASLAILAVISIPPVRSSIEKEQAIESMASLKDSGGQLNSHAADTGYYPRAFCGGPPWVGLQDWSDNKILPGEIIQRSCRKHDRRPQASIWALLAFCLTTVMVLRRRRCG